MSVTLKLDEHDAQAIEVALECMAEAIEVWWSYKAEDGPPSEKMVHMMLLVQGQHLLFDDTNSTDELRRLAHAFGTAVKANAPELYGLRWPDPD